MTWFNPDEHSEDPFYLADGYYDLTVADIDEIIKDDERKVKITFDVDGTESTTTKVLTVTLESSRKQAVIWGVGKLTNLCRSGGLTGEILSPMELIGMKVVGKWINKGDFAQFTKFYPPGYVVASDDKENTPDMRKGVGSEAFAKIDTDEAPF